MLKFFILIKTKKNKKYNFNMKRKSISHITEQTWDDGVGVVLLIPIEAWTGANVVEFWYAVDFSLSLWKLFD